MKRILLFTLLIICTLIAIAENVTLVTTGTAKSKEGAINDALYKAFQQQFGLVVEMGSYIDGNGNFVEDNNNWLKLWGNIEKVKSYKVISITSTKDKSGFPRMMAKVEVVFDMDKIEEHDENR